MKLTMLGTGNAMVTQCYNTCFILSRENQYFLVDGGGGNGLLKQLKAAEINWKNIRRIFLTHRHIDHLPGVIWMVRLITQAMSRGEYEGEAEIYAHRELTKTIREISELLLQKKQTDFIGKRLHLIPVEDGEEKEILGQKTVFFDIRSTKTKQFGFTMYLEDGGKLTCCGDEPFQECEESYARGSKWLLHEAFCLYSQADRFKPYEKHHSTVKDACCLAERLGVANLVLYHTEDQNIRRRKELYTQEGARYFSGNLYVPEDLESFAL